MDLSITYMYTYIPKIITNKSFEIYKEDMFEVLSLLLDIIFYIYIISQLVFSTVILH